MPRKKVPVSVVKNKPLKIELGKWKERPRFEETNNRHDLSLPTLQKLSKAVERLNPSEVSVSVRWRTGDINKNVEKVLGMMGKPCLPDTYSNAPVPATRRLEKLETIQNPALYCRQEMYELKTPIQIQCQPEPNVPDERLKSVSCSADFSEQTDAESPSEDHESDTERGDLFMDPLQFMSNVRKHRCYICFYSTNDPRCLIKHCRTLRHIHRNRELKTCIVALVKRRRYLQCEVCHCHCCCHIDLFLHYQSCCKNRFLQQKHKCDRCNFETFTSDDLSDHGQRHTAGGTRTRDAGTQASAGLVDTIRTEVAILSKLPYHAALLYEVKRFANCVGLEFQGVSNGAIGLLWKDVMFSVDSFIELVLLEINITTRYWKG